MINKEKLFVTIIIQLFIFASFTTLTTAAIKTGRNLEINEPIENISNKYDDETEYWALIVGVGVYAGHPEKEIASILDAEHMYDALTSHEHWQDDHLKVITGEDATKINIIRGLLWLDKMEDENDFSLVYISTHGWYLNFYGLPLDLPPFDEKDRCDEILLTYYGFEKSFTNLRDDELNFFLSRLESQGVCVIIDSCHAGGFNDPPRKTLFRRNLIFQKHSDEKNSLDNFAKEFSEEITKSGRVVLMGTREDEVGWSAPGVGGCFTTVLIESLGGGFGDFNGDGWISAEEVFDYTKTRVGLDEWASQHPTIYDGFEGELLLTISRYDVTFFDDFESPNDVGWKTIDHTGDSGGDLWHLTESDYVSPTHCWYLGNEITSRYNNNMNNSLISPEIELGEKPIITFNQRASREFYDNLYLDVSIDNWSSYKTTKLYPWSWSWETEKISLYSYPFWDLSGETVQIRFRFVSDEDIPFNPRDGVGYIMIDDIQVYSERTGG